MELGKARSTEEIIKDIKSTLETRVKDNVATQEEKLIFFPMKKGL